MNECLVHYSDSLVQTVTSVDQHEAREGIGKPTGLWVSVEGNADGWREWCIAEEFSLDRLSHIHDVELAADAKILRLCGADQIDAFTRQYRDEERKRFFGGIDWRAVSTQYQGIIISPYIWSCRLNEDTGWYYSWDCASGCIWDARAIASVTLREIVAVPARLNAEESA